MRRKETQTFEDYKDLRKKQRELDKKLLKGKLLFMSIPDLNTMQTQKAIADKERRSLKFKGHVYKGISNMQPLESKGILDLEEE